MNRRKFVKKSSAAGISLALASATLPAQSLSNTEVKSVGMIGLDTSHCTAFTKILNDPQAPADVSGYPVTHAYPFGSKTIESSYSRIPKYTDEVKKLGVEIVESLSELIDKVDVVLLESNDGRLHLEQALMVIEQGKPLFIDKPIAASLQDAIKIFEAADRHQCAVFSASSLRFSPSTQAIAQGKLGDIVGASTYSPAKIEPTHPDLFWYGIHGVESLFTVMGRGCKQVRRMYTPEADLVLGEWEDGRIGSFRGIRSGKESYGGTAFGTEGIAEMGRYEGYRPLVVEIIKFFRTAKAPVSAEETLEIFAFMQAAEESKKRGGRPVSVEAVLGAARKY